MFLRSNLAGENNYEIRETERKKLVFLPNIQCMAHCHGDKTIRWYKFLLKLTSCLRTLAYYSKNNLSSSSQRKLGRSWRFKPWNDVFFGIQISPIQRLIDKTLRDMLLIHSVLKYMVVIVYNDLHASPCGSRILLSLPAFMKWCL